MAVRAAVKAAEEELLLEAKLARMHPLKRWYLDNRRWILGSSGVAVFLFLWEASVRWFGANPLLVSSPTRVVRAAVKIFQDPVIYKDLYVSGTEFVLGFGAAMAVGILIGILAGWSDTFYYMVEPFLNALYSTPRVALLPVLVLWFGLGLLSKIVMVFLGAVFPIVINTISGIRTADRNLVRMARAFGADNFHLFKTVILPGAIPFLIAGLRLGAGRGLVSLVTAELYGATAGIGFRLTQYGQLFQISEMFVGVALIALMGVLTMELLSRVERRFERWRPEALRR